MSMHRVPPAPHVIAHVFEKYVREARGQGFTFQQYLEIEGCSNRAESNEGMDDGLHLAPGTTGAELISIPTQAMSGTLQTKVLLIDFPDKTGNLPVSHYENLLFSKGTHPTGSMRDYFAEVSLGKVDVRGTVEGWIRMPHPYSFYTNGESGLGPDGGSSYPRDARRMAEDAVKAALAQGVSFAPDLDLMGTGIITALFIVHAGQGAELFASRTDRANNIWSHKWQMVESIDVGNGLIASRYLTVPQACSLGVCAHELGHLAFQWGDFYDPNGSDDGHWDGSGDWDLMAGGSYNGDSRSPAHPAALHKLQHNWIEVEHVVESKAISIPVPTATSTKAVRVVSEHFRTGQYLVLENRTRSGFDGALPGEGMLVWRVDENKEQFAPERPGLLLIQADGRHDLERIESVANWNSGDAGDAFPGSTNRTRLASFGSISTSFPDGHESGIELQNISRDAATGEITLDVIFDGVPPGSGGGGEATGAILDGENTTSVPIPDANTEGITSTITLASDDVIRELSVHVAIEHTYIGDLRVELLAPNGQRAILHNRADGATVDLLRTWGSGTHAPLAELADGPAGGDWQLLISDLVGQDTGRLVHWSISIATEPGAGNIEIELEPGTLIPDSDPSGITSTLHVTRAGVARTVDVSIDIDHTFRGDLRVELVHPTGLRALLHNREGGREDDIVRTYRSVDSPALAAMVGKPVRGDWILRVTDFASDDEGTLKKWGLAIGIGDDVQSFESSIKAPIAIPDDDTGGVGVGFMVEHSGVVQSIALAAGIEHGYIGDLIVELIAPSGERALLHDRVGGRTRNVTLELDSQEDTALAGLIGQGTEGVWVFRVADLARWDKGSIETCSLRLDYVEQE